MGKLIYQDFGFAMPEQFKPYANGGTVLSMEMLVDKPAGSEAAPEMETSDFEMMIFLTKDTLLRTMRRVSLSYRLPLITNRVSSGAMNS
ncbi:hypothetical protein NST69_13080 [Paenibacillus sp. FSL P2-0089]|uniref:hypothetical protein n=1 Tax=Paenibacillus sp. FSL P2-0089 TaxID=2954526 RepID=UPI00315A1603